MHNPRDAFSHSIQCDELFSSPAVTHPGTGCLVGGFESSHIKCACWCHSAQHLFESPEPEYDLTPPPEYANSADAPFMLDEPSHVRIGFSNVQPEIFSAKLDAEEGAVVLDSHFNEIEARLFSVEQFPNRSRGELASGKCDTCGDKLTDCECVE